MARGVVVTGVSTGIGYATVQALHAHGFHVYGSVRKEADAGRLAGEFPERFTPLRFDVTDGEAIAAAAAQVRGELGDACLAGLVNNAGMVVWGPLKHLPVEQFQRQLDVNLTGVLRVTQAFLPLLGARKPSPPTPGRIVNIGSVSGKFAMPFLGPYAVSKFGVEALSDSLRRELMIYGIDVSLIEPGRIRTPIWKKVGDAAAYGQTDYADVLKDMLDHIEERMSTALPVSRVSATVVRALTCRRPRLRYPLPDQRFMGWILPKLMPARLLDRAIARELFGR